MIVVDTNVLAYRFIQGEKTDLALRTQVIDPDWRVPTLWRHEFMNVLATVCRHGTLSKARCLATWKRANEILSHLEKRADPEAVLSVSIEYGVSPCDSQYVVLAQSLGVLLVTEDRKVQKTFPDLAVSMKEFCAR